MIVDTGEFRAIQARLELADLQEDVLAGILLRMYDAGMKAGRELRAAAQQVRAAGQAPAGRHARPRRDRHGMRLIAGGGAR